MNGPRQDRCSGLSLPAAPSALPPPSGHGLTWGSAPGAFLLRAVQAEALGHRHSPVMALPACGVTGVGASHLPVLLTPIHRSAPVGPSSVCLSLLTCEVGTVGCRWECTGWRGPRHPCVVCTKKVLSVSQLLPQLLPAHR